MEVSEVWPDNYDEGIYTSISTWTHSQNSLLAVEALSLKISSYGTCLKWIRRPRDYNIVITTRIVISYAVKWGILIIVKSIETETTTWSEFPNGGRAIVEQILVQEEINKSKRAGMWDTVRDPSRKIKIIWIENL